MFDLNHQPYINSCSSNAICSLNLIFSVYMLCLSLSFAPLARSLIIFLLNTRHSWTYDLLSCSCSCCSIQRSLCFFLGTDSWFLFVADCHQRTTNKQLNILPAFIYTYLCVIPVLFTMVKLQIALYTKMKSTHKKIDKTKRFLGNVTKTWNVFCSKLSRCTLYVQHFPWEAI